MRKSILFLAATVGAFVASAGTRSHAQTTQALPTLNIGDLAPALKVGGWFKGAPATEFAPGKIYVVEFWATWCGPCKKMIPHLTELAKSYKDKATFIGVSIWEHPQEESDASIATLVTPVVRKMGDQMDYNVAADGIDHFMADSWMNAAGQSTIPTAFIIGKDKHIAWIGPPTDLAPVLDQILSDRWDIAAAKKRAFADRNSQLRRTQLDDAIISARNAGDDQKTLAAIDRVQAEFPALVDNADLISIRLESLLHCDHSAALGYIKALTARDGFVFKKPALVWAILRIVPKEPSQLHLDVQDWKAIAKDCQPMVDANDSTSWLLYSKYALVLQQAGEIHKAVQYQQKAVDIASKSNQANPQPLRPEQIEALKEGKEFLAALIASDKKSR